MLKKSLLMTSLLILPAVAQAAGADSPVTVNDTVATAQRPGLIKRIINYFNETNKTYPTKHVDFSFIGGPHYSSDSKFGLGLVASGLYTTDPSDTTLSVSNISIKADATTAAHFTLSLTGEHVMPHDDYRLNYEASFSSIDTKYWGIGYDQCSNNDNESQYKYLAANVNVVFARRFGSHFYIGPMATLDYVNARKFENPELWDGLPRHMFSYGIGLSLRYDTRDCTTEPERGVCVRMDQTFNGHWMGNRYGYNVNVMSVSWYGRLWRDAVLATRLHSRITWGDTPWGMMSFIGGSYDMRGYFEGRYRDKSEIDLCVELRQHVWRRNGVVLWGGVASVFPRFSDIRFQQLLPNWGIGYRWEFKQRVNVRVDLGFGRGQCGFIFNINEAF